MNIIICIDDKNGMMFSHRRQSQDRQLREQLLRLTGNHKLWMNAYTRKQFPDMADTRLITDEHFLEKAGDDDYCFVEDQDVSFFIEKIKRLILFKWNRHYPADTYFTLNLSGWTLEDTEDFPGYSHEKITKETYRK